MHPPDTGTTLTSLLEPLKVTDSLHRALAEPDRFDFYVWHGFTPRFQERRYLGDVPGRFWIPALFDTRRLARAVIELANKSGLDHDAALDRMQRYHSGLKHPYIGVAPFAFVEIDHLGKDEQIAAYEALTEATGLRWCLWVSSGGKSVHAYLRFTEPLTADDPLREEIQRLLIVTLQGDTQITNAGRLMRLPGFNSEERSQPALHLDADARYDSADVRDRLAAHARAMGIEDVGSAFEVLRLAERLEQRSKPSKVAAGKLGTEEAMELRALAADLRAHHADPDARDLRAARIATKQTVNVSATVPASGGTAVSGDAIRLTKAQADVYRNMAPGSVVPAPCCADHPDPKGYLFEPLHGRVKGYCNRHGVSFYEVAERIHEHLTLEGVEWVTRDDVDGIDAYLDNLSIGTEGPGTEPGPEDPGRPVWMRDTGDALVDEARRVARRLEYRRDGPPSNPEADAVAEAINNLDAPSNLNNRLIPHDGYLGEDLDTRGEVSEESSGSSEAPLSDEEVDAAVDHYARLGGDPIFCSRGQRVTIASGGPTAMTIRVPCKGYGCSVCAPRKMIALQAAATVIFGDEVIGAGWETVVFDCPSSGKTWDRIRQQLSSWASLRDRHHLSYGVRPGTNRVHVIYRDGDEPQTRTALHRTFIELAATYEAEAVPAIVDTIGQIDLTAWAAHDRRKHIDRGKSEMQRRITALHAEVFGAAGSKLTTAERRRRRETRVVLSSNETTDAIRLAAEKEMGGVATEAEDVAVDVRSRRAFTKWRFTMEEVDARVALQRVKDKQSPPQARLPSTALCELEDADGFIEVDIERTA